MSNKIIQFNKQEEQCDCPVCDIVNEYVLVAQQLESEEQLFELLNDLFAEGMKFGVTEHVHRELHRNAEMLDELVYGSEEECDCDECCCECNLED